MKTTPTTEHTVTAVGTVTPGSPLDRLFSHNECLMPGCGQQVANQSALCAAHRAEAEANR